MTDTVTIFERRTRSQVTLPDDILQITQRSPLKAARSALITQTLASTTEYSSSNTNSDNTDDELLLSPSKSSDNGPTTTTMKRSASPIDGGYSWKPGSPVEGRELKRVKRDFIFDKITNNKATRGNSNPLHHHPASHTRNLSEPNIVLRKRPSRQPSATPSSKPVSSSSDNAQCHSSPPRISGKDRAQSVPIFPSSYPIPFVDLKNPPPSPRRKRARSRSPSKDSTPRFRITQLPIPSSQLELILDESGAGDSNRQSDLVNRDSSIEASSSKAGTTPSDARDQLAHSPTNEPSVQPVFHVPSTPAFKEVHAYNAPLSPLTPLPETPHPLKFAAMLEDRSTTLSWGLQQDDEAPTKAQASDSAPSLIPSTTQSRLPRPSVTSIPPPAVPTLTHRAAIWDSKNATLSGKFSVAGKQASGSGTVNAFSILMKKSDGMSRGKGKGKGKEIPQLKPSTVPTFSGLPTKVKAKNVEEMKGKPKVTLKAKMKPRAKSEPKPAPLLIPIPSDEEDEPEPEKEELSETAIDHPPPTASSPPPSEPPTSPLQTSSLEPTPPERRASDKPPEQPLTLNLHEPNHIIEDDLTKNHGELEQLQEMQLASETTNLETDTGLEAAAAAVFNDTLPSEDTPVTSKKPASKLPLGKKRVPSSLPLTGRVTRSVSNRQSTTDPSTSAPSGSAIKRQASLKFGSSSRSIKRTASGTEKATPPKAELQPIVTLDRPETLLPPGSPMKLVSPARRSPRNLTTSKSTPSLNTPSKTPLQTHIPLKSTSTPSPSKIARSASLFSARPSGGASRAMSAHLEGNRFGAGGSSLSTLSNALEKLRMPPPSRPNTSMGFNRDTDGDEPSVDGIGQSKDDSNVGRKSLALDKTKGVGLARSATLGANHFSGKDVGPVPGKTLGPSGKLLKQMPLFFPGENSAGAGRAKTIFGFGIGAAIGRRPAQKASRNPGLPSVMASPMKGGGDADTTMTEDAMDEESEDNNGQDDVLMAYRPDANSVAIDGDKNKGKGKQRDFDYNSSRRASMASQLLSQSLSSLPATHLEEKGLMGPPAVPPGAIRSASSSNANPSTSTTEETSPTTISAGRRTSSRIAKAATSAPSTAAKNAAEPKTTLSPVNESMKVLKDCTIFVDVKTDSGEDAGSLFTQMLENLGARLLARVGQTCTHVVYKNGLPSTVNRYRLLRDPKPLVVGIAWVVDCVEQMKKVDEADFLIDLEEVNLLGGPNKRRRSMLPKLISREFSDTTMTTETGREDINDGDVSMEGSSSSMTIDDDLPPLERARRRKSMLTGPRP